MNKRAVEIAGFLAQNGWDDAEATPIAADLSPRRYARLKNSQNHHAILMDADADQKTAQFVGLAKILREYEISAPTILAADPGNGLVLMEDFGDNNFGRMMDGGENSAPLYRRALEILVQLHKSFDPSVTSQIDLPVFNTALFIDQVSLFLETYISHTEDRATTAEETESFRLAWQRVLQPIEAMPQTLMLRDFMPDNLMDMSGREGLSATGVLDFQDGGYGPIAYDITSLCEVVRRDGGNDILDAMIEYYHAQVRPSISIGELKSACRILSAQRHMRILGIVTRWSQQTGRSEKLPWLTRTSEYLGVLLQDSALQPVQEWMEQYCPLT